MRWIVSKTGEDIIRWARAPMTAESLFPLLGQGGVIQGVKGGVNLQANQALVLVGFARLRSSPLRQIFLGFLGPPPAREQPSAHVPSGVLRFLLSVAQC